VDVGVNGRASTLGRVLVVVLGQLHGLGEIAQCVGERVALRDRAVRAGAGDLGGGNMYSVLLRGGI
jgi:hypothetical protein